MENTAQDNDLIPWEEITDKNWVIFYGNEKYFIDEKTKDALLDGVKRKLAVIVIDGVIWTDKFSRILPAEMVKESEYLRKGFKKSKKEQGKWYDPKVSPLQYFD